MAGLTKKEADEVEAVRQAAFSMSANQQYRLAFMIAENIGHAIVSGPASAERKRHKRLEEHDILVARGEAEPF